MKNFSQQIILTHFINFNCRFSSLVNLKKNLVVVKKRKKSNPPVVYIMSESEKEIYN